MPVSHLKSFEEIEQDFHQNGCSDSGFPLAGFPKGVRLMSAKDYSRVFANAKAFRDPLFTLLARTNEHSSARLGLVVAKKKIRLAVHRNRIKRITRESFRKARQQLPNIDIILIAGHGMGRAENSVLNKSFQRQWVKMRRHYSSEKTISTQ